MEIAVITGASSGLGYEFVRQLPTRCKRLDEIWVIGRKKERLEALKKETDLPLRLFPYDLENKECYRTLQQELIKEQPTVRFLINSAGVGKHGDFQKLSLKDVLSCIQVNCTALTAMTYLILPFMKKNSRILQICSAAAFLPQPGFSVYAASKAYVYSFTKALQKEFRKQRIYLTLVCPGPVDTEFLQKDTKGYEMPAWKKPFLSKPGEVAALALTDSLYKKKLSLYGIGAKAVYILTRLLPLS